MKRRDFFKVGSLAVTAAAIGTLPLDKVYSKSRSGFSLEIVTDKEVKAIKLIEEFLRANKMGTETIKFSEYRLGSAESGDIVLFRNNKLVNYKDDSDTISEGLRIIASQLELPRVIDEPVRLRFYSDNEGEAAKHFLVFHNDMLVNKIDASEDSLNLKISGTKGDLMLNISGRKARVLKSSCTHKNCVNTGSISLANESIVCIPNNIVIIAE
jgi:hypothetical protein